MAPRVTPAALGMIMFAFAAGEAPATVTEYTDQTAFNAAISDSTTFTFDGLTPPGTLSPGDRTVGDLSFAAGSLSTPVVVGSGWPFFGGSSFFTATSMAPGIDPSELLCTLSGSTAVGFTYGDLDVSGGLPLTVTLSSGESFDLSTPATPGVDTGFVGFVSGTAITSVTFSDYSEGLALLQIDKSAGAAGVPEPGSFALLAAGLLLVLGRRRALPLRAR